MNAKGGEARLSLYEAFSLLYPIAKTFAVNPPRIFVARWCGKTAGMLAAFQGFTAPYGSKKTGAVLQMFSLSGIKALISAMGVVWSAYIAWKAYRNKRK